MGRVLRRLGFGFLTVLAAVIAVLIVIGLWLSTSLPAWHGSITVANLDAPAEIIRDRAGATRIYAKSQKDAYFALGFAHAQDRLWQMDTYRRIGAGRVAEVVGSPGLVVDRFTRTLGLYRSAEAQYARLSPALKEAVDAYTAGVNAYLAQHRGAWPPEFTLLGYRPAPWRPADSLVLGKLLALMLGGNWFDELRRAALLDRLTPDEVAFLMPTDLDDGPVTLQQAARLPADAKKLLAAVPDLLRPRRASNAWAVDGRHTTSGMPVLASDPHLGLTAPGIWYLATIEAPGLSMTGATVPGMPVHLLGHNGHIAWGLTTTYGDLTDLTVLDLAEDGTHYRDAAGAAVRFDERIERIAVRFGRDVTLTVRDTRYGPVISDVMDSAGAYAGGAAVVVLRASALSEADGTPEAMYAVNRATDWDSFLAALKHYGAPQQNFIYADTSGAIGFIAPGLIPIRATGRGLVPGHLPDNDWTGFVPFDSLPQQRGAQDGVILNANNRIVGPDYPVFIGADWEPPFRAQRLEETLRDPPEDTGGHAALQADTLSTMARDLVPLMLARLDRGDGNDARGAALQRLAAWNFHMNREAPAPLIFAAWHARLADLVFGDDLGSSGGSVDPRQLIRVLRDDLATWCDNRDTDARETCDEVTAQALDDALATLKGRRGNDIAAWRWGDAHPARFTHPLLSFLPGVPRWLGITVASSGGNYTLMRGSYGSRDGMFVNGHGAGYRAVYDLADLDGSLFMVAPGTSGNPYSRFFAERAKTWRDGGMVQLPRGKDAARNGARGFFTLRPREIIP